MLYTNIEAVLRQTEAIVTDVVLPQATIVDQLGQWAEPGLRALQAAGLGGLVAPTSCGGLGFGLLAVAQVCERLGQACASTGLCFGMHCVGTAVIAARATTEQQQHYLVPIVEGKHLTTLALSETGTGSHFYLPETKLSQIDDKSYLVNGTKTFITNGGYADSYVISTAAADVNAPPGTFSCLVIEGNTQGLIWGAPWNGLGMRGNSSRSLILDNVVVPHYALLGQEGDEIWYVFNVVAPYFLMAMSGTYLGIATAALEEGRKHLAQRHYTYTGTRLAQNNLLQHRLGTLWAQVERTRRLIYYAATEGDQAGVNTLPALLSAKAEVAECAVNVVNEVMTLMGGRAYQGDSVLHRNLRDARAAHVMAPTTEMLYTWLGRYLLDLPLLGE